MEGIQFVVNHAGERVAVLIDLQRYADIWEDFYDQIVASLRANEPREALDAVRERLRQQGKLDG